MQKYYYSLNISKPVLLLSGIIILLISVFFAHFALSDSSIQTAQPESAESTMYKQLGSFENLTQHSDGNDAKMNNQKNENASNIYTETKLPEITKLAVYDASSGENREMELEQYTLCVLAAEMPQNFEIQALMAQAVACRTFAVRSALLHEKHSDCDVCTDYRCCQSFIDVDTIDYDIQRLKDAVKATEGIIAVYNGEPILAAYHASSFGYTRSSAEVWGGALDYLVPVAAVEDREETAQIFRISENKVKSVLEKLGLYGSYVFSSDEEGICTGVSDGENFLSPRQIQSAFSLRSDTFSVSEEACADNDASREFAFTCYGYGHGVGMSQYGADALAGMGYDFYEILRYYYTGIQFDFVNT